MTLFSSLRRTDEKAANLLGFKVIETDKSIGVDNLWMSRDGVNPALGNDGEELELPFFSSSNHSAVDLMTALSQVCAEKGIGPNMVLVFDGVWHFRIGDLTYQGDMAQIITKGIVDYFCKEKPRL
jgi:hypothetical protein